MNLEEKNKGKKKSQGKFLLIYRSLSVFLMIYGLLGFIFYLSILFFPAFKGNIIATTGYNTFNEPAFLFILSLLLLLHSLLIIDGIFLLQSRPYAVSLYFGLLLFLFSAHFWILGGIDLIMLLLGISCGIVLLYCFKKIKKVGNYSADL